MAFQTQKLSDSPDVMAPDGSEVRILCSMSRGSMAHFTLPPNAVSIAVTHQTIEEVWFFVSGRGQMWRASDDGEEITDVEPGMSLTIPTGVRFQFRSLGDEALKAVGVAMPPWPGMDEAYTVDGPWKPTV